MSEILRKPDQRQLNVENIRISYLEEFVSRLNLKKKKKPAIQFKITEPDKAFNPWKMVLKEEVVPALGWL